MKALFDALIATSISTGQIDLVYTHYAEGYYRKAIRALRRVPETRKNRGAMIALRVALLQAIRYRTEARRGRYKGVNHDQSASDTTHQTRQPRDPD